jgi:G3E family GTPase
VTLFTGFLGSGKSTLVNRLLREQPHRRFGLVVNEFGDAAIESQLIQTQKQPLFELPAGCLCCVSDGDLEAALKALVRQDRRVDHILVEASGLSSPGPLVALLTADRPAVEFPFELGGVFCIVDASTFAEREGQWPAVHRQLAFADAVLLTKTDVATPETTLAVTNRLKAKYPRTAQYLSSRPLPWNLLFEPRANDPIETPDPGAPTPSSGRRFFTPSTLHDAQVLEFASDRPLKPQALKHVFETLEGGILRAKGVVYLEDPSATRYKYIVQYTGAQKQLYSRRWSTTEARRTNLVFLGTGFDAETLKEQLDCCQS